MIHFWKLPHIAKGMLSHVPPLNAWRMRRGATGGSSSARYCYAVWLRHLVVLDRYGFRIKGAAVGELGPGDSIGTGLAALLSGASRYIGLDVVPYSAKANLRQLARELAQLYVAGAPIPSHDEFPAVRPRLAAYDFPDRLVHLDDLARKVEAIDNATASSTLETDMLSYRAPWQTASHIDDASLDLVFSQAVIQYVDNLEALYRALYTWLKPGGYCSHATGLGANNFSPHWNGHWAYSTWEWRMVRGRREWLPNRRPLSEHLRLAQRAGFQILHVDAQLDDGGLPVSELDRSFQSMSKDDIRARGVMLILQKPHRRAC